LRHIIEDLTPTSKQTLDQVSQLVNALELHKSEADCTPELIKDKVKQSCLTYLHKKLELERIIAKKQRILLLISENQQIISKLKELCDEQDGRVMGDLKEKELLQLLDSLTDIKQQIKIEKQQIDRQLVDAKLVTKHDKENCRLMENQIMGKSQENQNSSLFNTYLASENDLEEYKDKVAKFKGLPSNVRLAKIKVAQAQEQLIQKKEQLNKVLESC